MPEYFCIFIGTNQLLIFFYDVECIDKFELVENSIKYIKGDATSPIGEGNKIIVHICNDIGAWGKGFVMALSAKWNKPETEYRDWYKKQTDFELGNVQFVQVEEDLYVANIIGQRDITKKNSMPPIRYEAVEEGLKKTAVKAKEIKASIHMPRIGSGLAGGYWNIIESIIIKTLIDNNVEVTVYDFE
jgi:O-acetyl-ADP-ribose deacetylase (regulator of RNase III)